MDEFKHEKRYTVTKIGKPDWNKSCVVVEEDWPEYEIVWDMIQRRMEGRPTILDAPLRIIEKLQGQVVSVFSGERVPQFRQGCPEHELEEAVTAEDCTYYTNVIEQQAAKIAELQEQQYELMGVVADVEQGHGFDEVCLHTIKRVMKVLNSTNSNWLAEHDAEVLKKFRTPTEAKAKMFHDMIEMGDYHIAKLSFEELWDIFIRCSNADEASA